MTSLMLVYTMSIGSAGYLRFRQESIKAVVMVMVRLEGVDGAPIT